jgi:hypothetical protein
MIGALQDEPKVQSKSILGVAEMLRNRTQDKNLAERDLTHIHHMYSSNDINI